MEPMIEHPNYLIGRAVGARDFSLRGTQGVALGWDGSGALPLDVRSTDHHRFSPAPTARPHPSLGHRPRKKTEEENKG